MRTIFLTILFTVMSVQAQAPSSQTAATEFALLGVRVLKIQDAGQLPWSVVLPTTCAGCQLKNDPFTGGQNGKEIFFHILVPASEEAVHDVHVKIDPTKVRGVVIGRADSTYGKTQKLSYKTATIFKTTADGITVDIPLSRQDVPPLTPLYAVDVTEQYSFIDTPGVEIRIEHADKDRRGGPYVSGRWPAPERQAALNLEFAAREAITVLGLDRSLTPKGVTNIHLMGFDTSYPTLSPTEAHDDWPPHWHMIVLWNADPSVHKVGHFYITPDGLLDENDDDHWYTRGVADDTITPDGEVLYSQTITREGYFTLTAPSGTCQFTPVSGGFQSGVNLVCGKGAPSRRIRAEDDPDHERCVY